MKYPIAKIISTIIFLIIANVLFANNPGKDFLITLNGSKLTGDVIAVLFLNGKSRISFENDFGDVYTIHPATIYGFAFEENGETSIYESKNLDGEWRFLKVERKGQTLTLYTSSERQLKLSNSKDSPIVVEERNPQFWLQFKEEPPFKIYRFNYKRILQKKMFDYPDIEKRIGKKNFRYKNIPAIIDLFNRSHIQQGNS